MPDFVKEGEVIDEVAQSPQKPGDSNRLDYSEPEVQEDEAPRKTLHDQLVEHREKKQQEFQEQLESRNSSYKLDAESAAFYEKIRKAAEEKEQRDLKDEQAQLALFRERKEAKLLQKDDSKPQNSSLPSEIKLPKITKKRIITETSEKPSKKTAGERPPLKSLKSPQEAVKSAPISNILEGYSSSEEE